MIFPETCHNSECPIACLFFSILIQVPNELFKVISSLYIEPRTSSNCFIYHSFLFLTFCFTEEGFFWYRLTADLLSFCSSSPNPASLIPSSFTKNLHLSFFPLWANPSGSHRFSPPAFLLPTHPSIPVPDTSRHSLWTPAEQSRETGQLTEDLHFFLTSSKPNAPVSSLSLQQNSCFIFPSSLLTSPMDPRDLSPLTSFPH